MDWNAPPPPDSQIPTILARLIGQWRPSDVEQRRDVIRQVYELAFKVGPKAAESVPVLIDALGDEDAKVGESAMWALKYCAPESIADVTNCLTDARAVVRERAAESLGNMGEDAAAAAIALRPLLADPVEAVRSKAAWALGLMRDVDTESVEPLLALAEHGSTSDKRAALHALGNIGRADEPVDLNTHRPLMERALGDPDADVRWSALYALGALPIEAPDGVALLTRQLVSDPSERVQQACLSELRNLAKIEDLSAHSGLLVSYLQRGGAVTSSACEVVENIKTPTPEVISALRTALEGDDTVVHAARALWKLTGDASLIVPALIRAFDAQDESVCDLVCELGAEAKPLVPQLVAALATENWDLQWAAADALRAVADQAPEVIAALLEAMDHPSPIVRSSSARALAAAGRQGVSALMELLEATDPRGPFAAMALTESEQRPSDALPALRKGMSAGAQPFSGCCAIALATHTAEAAVVPHLVDTALSDHPSAPREAAIQALQALGPAATPAIPALEGLARGDDQTVAQAAREALETIQRDAH